MNTIYNSLVDVIGSPPEGYEFILYIGAVALLLMFFKLCVYLIRCVFGLEK